MGMGVAIPESGDRIEKSMGLLIKAQFTDADFFAVVGNTEFPARVINDVVILLTIQRVMEILSTPNPDEIDWGDTEEAAENQEKEIDKFKLRTVIEKDPKAMQATILYGWNYYYSLCMRSKDRKGRGEGTRVIAGAGTKEAEENVGLTPRILHALGLGKLTKYQKVYVDKEG